MSVLFLKVEWPEVKIIEPTVYGDSRGFFYESFQHQRYEELLGIKDSFVQDNCSSSKKGVLRGLHYQSQQTQGKLISVFMGTVFDIVVDIRLGSPTYGQWVGEILSGENKHQMWIPEGFAHGFYVLSDMAYFSYKCTDYYHPQSEISIHYLDEQLAIDWPLEDEVTLSEKDAQAVPFNLIAPH